MPARMKSIRNWGTMVLMAIALLTIISCTAKDKKLTFNGGDLYYSSKVTEADAKKLGNYLVEDKFFDGTQKTVKLNKSGGNYEFRMVLKDAENDPGAEKKYSAVSRELSQKAFSGQRVVIHLCDKDFKTLVVAGGD
jgi:hypothetical protein